MKIGNENFRKLYKKPVIIKDREMSHQISKSLMINDMWEDDMSSEELEENAVNRS